MGPNFWFGTKNKLHGPVCWLDVEGLQWRAVRRHTFERINKGLHILDVTWFTVGQWDPIFGLGPKNFGTA